MTAEDQGETRRRNNDTSSKRRQVMKKLVILAVALLIVPASAMAGMTAFMNMDELNSKEMATVTGQTGISIDSRTMIDSGQISWTDTTCLNIVLGSIDTTVTGLEIDAVASKLRLTLSSAPTINAQIASISTSADTATLTPSMGQFTIKDLVIGGSTIDIYGH